MEAWDQSLRETRRNRSSSPLGVEWEQRICLPLPPTGLNRDIQHPADLPFSVPPSLKRHHRWCRNINLLSITYAFRPRLRDRLTLGRLTLPRKPWAYGEWVSHPFYRYSCLHKLFQDLQQSLRSTFTGDWNAPLPLDQTPQRSTKSAASVSCLSPVTFSAQTHLTSELLRFL